MVFYDNSGIATGSRLSQEELDHSIFWSEQGELGYLLIGGGGVLVGNQQLLLDTQYSALSAGAVAIAAG